MRYRSPKRARQERQYSRDRKTYLAAWPRCEAETAHCEGRSTEVHHMRGRQGARLLDQEWWLAVCSPCHRHITEHPAEALREGWSARRNL